MAGLGGRPAHRHRVRYIATVVYGPGSMTVAHTADEYVPLAELTEAAGSFASVYASFADPFAAPDMA